MRLLSVVVPAHNEEESIGRLALVVNDVAEAQRGDVAMELILVDDGSTDQTWAKIEELKERFTHLPLRAFRFRRNFGKAAALDLGFRHATGEVIVTLDADLQDDPAEIRRLLAKLDEG
jgi:glycosyltransferase involved in cell wall biosynthesis